MLAAVAAGCCHIDAEVSSRAPAPLDDAFLAELRPQHAGVGLELELAEETADYWRSGFQFQTYCELTGDFKTVKGELYRTRKAEGGMPAPLVVLAPILAGPVDDYRDSRYFAAAACAHGLSAFFLHQEAVVLDPERDAFALERRLRENIRDNIRALDLLAALPEVDGSRLGSLGISLGALKNIALIAAEPRLRANVLCLAGTDLAEILLTSREALVTEYLAARRDREGLTADAVAEEVRRDLRSDPLYCVSAIAGDRVLLFLARFDDKVPYATGLRLREDLGRPETWVVPLGHYSSVLIAPWVADVAGEWLRERLTASRLPTATSA